ncbi:hypothetical protein RF11_04152 [Thelohanellus kitauei]|uniref:Uncharacterized protein n=1 Tax=Thelohanellus kitauei TaxID=669202 RepID=A0A0C2J871_THEKT|nr:hypothetical protein RF11_04152 [Thelohanellus kitauei]
MYPQQHYTRPYFYHPVPFYGFYDPFAAFNYYNNNYLYLANQNQLNGFHPYQNFVNNNEITTKPRTRGRPRKNDEKIVELVGWKEKKICCGKIFIGPQHQILLHPLFIRPHRGKCAYKIISDIPKKTELRIEASKENKADDGLRLPYQQSRVQEAAINQKKLHKNFLLKQQNINLLKSLKDC